jgi:hypothetical protein
MYVDQFFGSCKRLVATLKSRCGVSGMVLPVVVCGNRNQLTGRIQRLRGEVRAASKAQLRDWHRAHNDLRTGLLRNR